MTRVVVRGGRVIARALLIWLLSVLVLRLLDVWLDGFAMPQWWQPTVVALLFGLLTAVLWPLVARIALPLALFTFGLGSFVLLAAGLLVISHVVPGVVITDLTTAVVVTVAMTIVAVIASSILAIDPDELFFRRATRRARGTLGPDGHDDRPPGVLFLQVDGLGVETLRRAVRDGDMPTFAAWLDEGSHVLGEWHTDWSSQTGASVCGLLHGSNDDILGFRWYEKDRDHVMYCGHPEDAAEIERRHSDGRGLLAVDGAARGSLFTGDAPHVSLTMSAVPLLTGRGRRGVGRVKDGVGAGYYAYFALPGNALRTLWGALIDVFREISASTRQARAGVRPRVARGGFYPFARASTTVIVRDVVVSAILGDMLDGRACVFADFLGYDEVAHHSGVERFDSLHVLRTIDQQIGRLHRATQLSPRRYQIVAFSDHGQTQGWCFADRFGESIEEFVGRLCGAPSTAMDKRAQKSAQRRPVEGWQAGAALAEAAMVGPVARRLRSRVDGHRDDAARPRTADGAPGKVARAAPGIVVLGSGHVAMVSLVEHSGRVPLETIEREYPELLPGLVDHPGVGFVLVRSSSRGPLVMSRDGLLVLETGELTGDDPLADYGPHAAELIRRVDTFEHCPDVMINSRYRPASDDAPPFEPHVGSHGGLGGAQSRGFLLRPASLPDPAEIVGGEIVGAEALHRTMRGWLTHLGHPVPAPVAAQEAPAVR